MMLFMDYSAILHQELTAQKRTLLTLKGFKEPKDFDKPKAKETLKLTSTKILNNEEKFVCHALCNAANETQLDIESFKYLIKVVFCLSPKRYLQAKQDVWFTTDLNILITPKNTFYSTSRENRIEILKAASILLHNNKIITQPRIHKTRSNIDALSEVME